MRGGEPTPIQKILQNVLSRRGLTDGGQRLAQVRRVVDELLEQRLKGRVRVVALRGNTVTLEADSAGLAYELKAFHGAKLLAGVKKRPETEFVARLLFKSGAVADGR